MHEEESVIKLLADAIEKLPERLAATIQKSKPFDEYELKRFGAELMRPLTIVTSSLDRRIARIEEHLSLGRWSK